MHRCRSLETSGPRKFAPDSPTSGRHCVKLSRFLHVNPRLRSAFATWCLITVIISVSNAGFEIFAAGKLNTGIETDGFFPPPPLRGRILQNYSSTMRMVVAGSSKTSVRIYLTIQRRKTEDCNFIRDILHRHRNVCVPDLHSTVLWQLLRFEKKNK